MLKHLNGLLCLQFKRRKWLLYYVTIEWYCGVNSFTYGYFSVLKKMVEYSQVKVISKDLVNIFFNIDFKCFLIFKPSVYVFSHLLYIQILMYGNLDFLVKALSVVGVLYVSVLMSLFIFRQKIIAISRPKR